MKNDIQYKQGRMVKDPQSMQPAEHAEWQRQCAQYVRGYLFSIGQPLVYRRSDGHTIAEYADGRVVVIR
ncbi:MAG: hypothetical protein EAZ91_04140 [Cytophagales bacterium]|nr:MAG: hypothetical protein EAZ91_04140 [Cytophagales bacterium]